MSTQSPRYEFVDGPRRWSLVINKMVTVSFVTSPGKLIVLSFVSRKVEMKSFLNSTKVYRSVTVRKSSPGFIAPKVMCHPQGRRNRFPVDTSIVKSAFLAINSWMHIGWVGAAYSEPGCRGKEVIKLFDRIKPTLESVVYAVVELAPSPMGFRTVVR